MKVLLNDASLAPPLSGIGVYTFHLASRLGLHPEVSAVCRFSESGSAARLWVPPLVRKLIRKVPFAYRIRNGATDFRLRRRAYSSERYVYHEPNYVLAPYQGPTVVTVSDLSHLRFPAYHPRERVQWLAANLRPSVTTAHQVICHSNVIRDELQEHFALPPDKVRVVYHGVSGGFRPRTDDELAPVLRRLGLKPGRYVLSVGTMEPRKNLVGLMQAFDRLPKSLRMEFPLALVGPRGWITRPIEKAMAPYLREGSLRLLGYLSMEDLPFVYCGARVLAYLSFYEGFGLPVIEAMASGTPVLASNASALPEIAGGAGTLVDPRDPEQIAHELGRLLQSDGLHRQCSAAGLERARRFSWSRAIDETVAVYRRALAEVQP